jgi:hypothetical protein
MRNITAYIQLSIFFIIGLVAVYFISKQWIVGQLLIFIVLVANLLTFKSQRFAEMKSKIEDGLVALLLGALIGIAII